MLDRVASQLYSHEDRVILACICGQTKSRVMVHLLDRSLQWDRLVRRTLACRVAPWVYFGLKSLADEGRTIPTHPLQRLHDISSRQAVHLQELLEALEEVLGRFARAGISAIVLKGAALALTAYKRPYMRMVGDLDLLLAESDLTEAAQILREMGFRQRAAAAPYVAPADHFHLPAFHLGESIVIELHSHIVARQYQNRLAAKSLWSGALPLKVGAVESQMLSVEYSLLHTALHASINHGFHGMLYQFCDIREIVIRHGAEIDWTSLIAQIRESSFCWPVYLSFDASRELTGAAIPGEVLDQLRPRRARWSPRQTVLNALIPRLALTYDYISHVSEWLDESIRALVDEGREWAAWNKMIFASFVRFKDFIRRRL